MATFQIVIRNGPNPGKNFPLEHNEMFIGRELGNDIVINDPEVSRRHARIFVQGSNYVIEDLGSTNGTTVNGQRLMGPYLLRPGEIIQFGEKVRIQFESVQTAQDATIAASSPQTLVQIPAPTPPPPAPAYTPPQQSYSAPVPVYTPPPVMPEYEETPKKKKFPTWLVIILIVLLLCICVCVVGLVIIDSQNMWCSMMGPLFNAVSPGTCQ